MSEELYFFKFNRQRAKENLTRFISKESDFSYSKYLLGEFYKEEDLSFEDIKNKIEENVELLSKVELWSLFDWFGNLIEFLHPELSYSDQENKVLEQMNANGLELFYEIPSKTPVRNFHSILFDYECLAEVEIDYKSSSADLLAALNYIICYTGELTLFLNKYYYKYDENHEYNLEIQKTIDDINLSSNGYFHQLAISELAKTFDYNKETMKMVPKLIEFRMANRDVSYSIPSDLSETYERESDIVNLASVLWRATEIKEELLGYNGQITRLHSF